MAVTELTWYYPEKISDAVKLLDKEGVVLHGGGTRILKTKSNSLKGIVDLSALDLNYIKQEKKNVVIGAGATFTDIIKFSKSTGLISALGTALKDSGSAPLRNRITVGGSLKDFPLWSSLYAPLIALGASIEIAGPKKITCTVEEYVHDHIIKTKHLIKQIIIPIQADLICKARKFTLLRFEYPMFVVAVAFKLKGKKVKEAAVVITGVKGRIHRYPKSEKAFIGSEINEDSISKSLKHFSPKFHDDFRYSGEYKEYLSKVTYLDLMNELAGELK